MTAAATPLRVAGAPISWGICEVPGWGHQLGTERVLDEMRELGLSATEFGPDGFLPAEPAGKAAVLAGHGLTAVGAFVPVVLHRPDVDLVPTIRTVLAAFEASGANTLVLAAATGQAGYDSRPELDDTGWRTLLTNLELAHSISAEHAIAAVLHPHVGTMVETDDEVSRVLDGCAVPLCLDTGHLLIGGCDPAALAAKASDRVGHVHLKDVDAGWAARVRDGDVEYAAAVAAGMYRPLGAGDVDIAGVVRSLAAAGYAGWYVLEQDCVLTAEPAPGHGPQADVAQSLRFLREVSGDA